MPRIHPLPESEAQDKLERTYGRIKEMLGSDTVPEPFLTYGRVDAFLQDFYMNFKKFVYTDGALDAKTKAILGLAVSGHYGCPVWLDFFTDRLKSLGAEEGIVADVMSVGLRAHTFTNTSLDEKTVELINTAISNLNACKPCTSGHVTKSRDLGASDDQILEAIQCAATMAAGCSFLKAAEA